MDITIAVINTLVFLIVFIYLYWKLWFLRDPARKIPGGDSIVSPADGRVIDAFKLDNSTKNKKLKVKKGAFGKIFSSASEVMPGQAKGAYVVSIFMSVFDVHVQRAPVSGSVEAISYKKGKFIVASSLDAFENEKNEILIKYKNRENKSRAIKVIQIAGFLARRIECFVRPGQKLLKGQKIGRINLGSQVTVIMPGDVRLKVKKGQRVYAGTTVIAEFNGRG